MKQSLSDIEYINQQDSGTFYTSLRNKTEMKSAQLPKPTSAFVGASWAALFLGAGAYLIGLWNADMQLNEKGYYFTLLLFGLFSSVSLQKSVRDKLEGIKVTAIYYGLSWFSLAASVGLLAIGLFNATLALSEKGFYAMAFSLCLFAAIAVQKNTRDMAYFEDEDSTPAFDSESTDEA